MKNQRAEHSSIYGLVCTCHSPEEVRYIGKTVRATSTRMAQHRFQARHGSQLPVHKWMRKHGVENTKMIILFTSQDYEELCAKEIELISLQKTGVEHGGLNVTIGGDGSLGWKHSLESRKKISDKATQWHIDHPTEKKVKEKRGKAFGSRVGLSKLTEENVVRIKELLFQNNSHGSIAEDYGVTSGAISAIEQGRTWRHIPWPEGERVRVVHQRRRSTMTREIANEVMRLHNEGKSGVKITEALGVNRVAVYRVINGERFSDLLDLVQ